LDYLLLLKAAIIGLSIAAPVGPIGLLCMQRTLTDGPKAGFVCGLGAATADGVYGIIGALGLTTLTQFFTSAATPLSIFGATFLIWIGVKLLKEKSQAQSSTISANRSYFKSFLSTLLLTLANPLTILSFVAVFSALSTRGLNYDNAITMVVGVFLGSAIWWLLLAGGVSVIRHKINAHIMQKINQGAGALLLTFGIWQLSSVIF
jgi:threonine/homoserine/homoserine lactone efflux protein